MLDGIKNRNCYFNNPRAWEYTMSSAILMTIKLRGQIDGPQKHVDKQIVTVDVTKIGSKYPEVVSKKITFNDRIQTECYRKMKISEEIVSEWENSECPHWEKPGSWKSMTRKQKLESHIKRYDEGFGVTYDFIQ
jgi:hypothetical protein